MTIKCLVAIYAVEEVDHCMVGVARPRFFIAQLGPSCGVLFVIYYLPLLAALAD